MQDDFRIDSHKLIFHVERLNDWLSGKIVCPIYLEIAPAGGCNHRCIFCALDYLKYKPHYLDLKVLKNTLKTAAGLGVKSIMYAGEGEPLLHKDFADIVKYTKEQSIDVALTSNGLLLNKELSEKILKFLTWIRISFNAGTSKTYAKIHRTKISDFYKVLDNLKSAVAIKRKHKLDTTIGVQCLLIPENINEIYALAAKLKRIGVDYLVIKPYSHHPLSHSRINPKMNYRKFFYLDKKLQKLTDSKFKIIFRNQTMLRLSDSKDYRRCLGLPFWAYINACGDVYACSAFLGKKNFCYGNIYKNSFGQIINSARRKDILNKVSCKLNVDKCRQVCRLDKINAYLWELKHPKPHINFI